MQIAEKTTQHRKLDFYLLLPRDTDIKFWSEKDRKGGSIRPRQTTKSSPIGFPQSYRSKNAVAGYCESHRWASAGQHFSLSVSKLTYCLGAKIECLSRDLHLLKQYISQSLELSYYVRKYVKTKQKTPLYWFVPLRNPAEPEKLIPFAWQKDVVKLASLLL